MKKIFKRVICAALVLILLFSCANVAFAGDIIVYNSDVIEPKLYNTASNGSFDNLEAYIGDIDEFQKYILNCLMRDESNLGSLTGRGNIDISMYNIPVDDAIISELMNLLWYESPELFRLSGSMSYSYTSSKILELKPNYEFSTTEDFKMWYDVFVDVVSDLVSDIKGKTTLSEAEKALLLHDRLITYCEYDYENYCQGMVPQSSYSAYGVFCLGTAVCQGYALAYDYLLEQVGIEAEYCSSDTLNHAWNIVYIDGKPYYVDTSNDDPVWDVPGRVKHDNFLRSPEAFKETGHNANDYKVIPSYTTYDNAFWQNSTTEFQFIDNKIYYIDNAKQELNVIDDITDTTPETIAKLDYRWTTANGQYYSGNYSKLAAIRENLFYSTPTTVYCYNTTTKKTKTVITEEDIIEITGEDIYRIYAMSDYGCTLAVNFTESPNFNAETKNGHGYWGGYHNPTENWITVIEPTNSKQGKEVNVCIDCGREVASRLIDALDDQHIWSEWYIDPNNKPTCTEKGVILRDCSHCGVQEWDYGTALGHNYSTTYTVVLEPTCVRAGTKVRCCTRCDNMKDITEIPATGIHIEGDAWIKGKAATCKEDGYIYKACKGCGKEMSTQVLPKGDCSDFSVTGYKAATCTVNGYSGDKTCRDCGAFYKGETILAKGHTEVTVKGKEATCIATGLTNGKKCSVCGVTTVTQQVIAKKSHKITIVGKKDATTKEPGYTGDKVCSVCGTVTENGMEIPKLLSLATPKATTKNTTKGIQVSWGVVANAEKYVVYQRVYNASTKKYSGWKAIKTTTGLSYTDATVKLGTTYSYTVKAVSGTVSSKYTATKGITYNVTPTVKVALASNGIKVSWSTAANATGYTIYSSTYNTKTKKWSGWTNRGTVKTTSWTDTSAKSGTKYRYTVKAMNNKVASTYNKSGVSTLFLSQPTVKIANASTGVKVTWNKITGATGYKVYRSQYSNGKWSGWKSVKTIDKGSTTSWTDKKVTSGVKYKYTVKAVNGKTVSTYKSSSSLLYLVQPTVTVKAVSTGVNVTWTQSSGATGYIVYYSIYNVKTKKWSAWTNRVTTTKTSWTDENALSGVKYKYTVRAINGNTKSAYVSSASLLYLEQPSFNVIKNENAITVSWYKIAGATGYRVYRKANNETKWSTLATIKTTSYVDKSVSDDGIYTYTVRAYNGKVWSSYDTTGVTISLDYKKAILELVNKERAKEGLSPLEYYTEGQKAADIRADEISTKFTHERPDGTMCFTALKAQGISYYSAGENIAIGFYTPESVMNAWMNSEGHRANILTPGFTHIIVGYDETSNSWVQLFLGNPYKV